MGAFDQKQTLGFGTRSQSPSREDHPAPVRFTIDPKRRLVIAKFGERITAHDIHLYVQNLCSQPGFDPSYSEVADISSVKELPLEGADFLKLADQVDPFAFQSKRAFVAQTPVQRHAAQMHKILRTQRHFEIFATLEEAEQWIGR